ncbi:MAG: hypothetical protein RI922_1053 [Bacteroidota bacterium]|jgi:hypothetical protein
MTKSLLFVAIATLLSLPTVYSQNVKTETTPYTYIQLPTNPLAKTITGYQSTVQAVYEAENQKKNAAYEAEMAAAEADYQRELAAYPAKQKAAEDKYAAELAEYEKKSLATKVVEKQILNENNKPIKQVPPAPYKRYVAKPVLQRSYDYAALAGTYLTLGGYENSSINAVKIEVTLNGFDYTKPVQLTEVKKEVTRVNGTSTTNNVTYYHVEFTYRHTMSVKVTLPDGKELFFLSPQELNTYKTYKSAETKTSQTINEEQLVQTYEEKILQENLKFIGDLVNDRIGFKPTERQGKLSYVKSKDETYTDLMKAYNEGSSALKTLKDDEVGSKAKLMAVAQTYQTVLLESNLNDKKARIDKEVTTMIYFNLLEIYFASRDVAAAEKTLSSLNGMDLSNGDRKEKEVMEKVIIDLKKRVAANSL